MSHLLKKTNFLVNGAPWARAKMSWHQATSISSLVHIHKATFIHSSISGNNKGIASTIPSDKAM
jgi:hypothetical protein